MTNKQTDSLAISVFLLSVAIILFPEISFAGTGGEELKTTTVQLRVSKKPATPCKSRLCWG
jgi:hypothetical protein